MESAELMKIKELEKFVKASPDNENQKYHLAIAYNNYIVDSWEKSPYEYGVIGKVLTSREATERALLYFQLAKDLRVEDKELNQTLDKNIEYANWAFAKHIDWGFDRTLNLTDIFTTAVALLITLLIIGVLMFSGNFIAMVIGVGLLALYIWKKFIPGWKIHKKQLEYEKMLHYH